MADLKIDLINKAYSQMRISGMTLNPTPEENELALDKLEDMMSELFGRNIDVSYNFEDAPDLNSYHNVERKYWYSIASMLGLRLCDDFGRAPTQLLVAAATAGLSFLSSSTALVTETPYPTRMPVGSGNSLRYNRVQRFYPSVENIPLSSKTVEMYVGDIDDFVEHFDSYLKDGETISSYTIAADTGLTLSNDANADPDITYTITAVGSDTKTVFNVKIVVTLSSARKLTRVITFHLTEAPTIA